LPKWDTAVSAWIAMSVGFRIAPLENRGAKMIKHVVFMKFKKETTEEDIAAIERGLGALPDIISEIKGYEFGRDVLRTERSYDFALVSAFDDLDALQRYSIHPDHQVVVQKCREASESIVAVDFEY
jgi:hypothetical protein